MKREDISNALNDINPRHIQEALAYKSLTAKTCFRRSSFGKTAVKTAVAAVLLVCLVLGGIRLIAPSGSFTVSAYAYGTDQKLTSSEAVLETGSISDTGEMKGPQLMFYLTGKNIASVRFSCKNQLLQFTDWTEEREEFGLAQNFTVPYGADESTYYYLTIHWVPKRTIRALTDNADTTIASLPQDLREDVIVMEITFSDGTTAAKAIHISLLPDGNFTAAFDDYHVTEQDSFLLRPDSKSLREKSEDKLTQKEEASEQEPADSNPDTADKAVIESAKEAALDYYKTKTIFEVVSIDFLEQDNDEIGFSVCVSKGGIIQEPNRMIYLKITDSKWEMTREGY